MSNSLAIYAPRLECGDCGMPLKDPDIYGKDGYCCSYDGYPEHNRVYSAGPYKNTENR